MRNLNAGNRTHQNIHLLYSASLFCVDFYHTASADSTAMLSINLEQNNRAGLFYTNSPGQTISNVHFVSITCPLLASMAEIKMKYSTMRLFLHLKMLSVIMHSLMDLSSVIATFV